MFTKLVALTAVLSVVAAQETVPISESRSFDMTTGSQENQQLSRILPDVPYLLLDIVNALIGVKFTALSLGVSVIEWLVSNSLIILIGAAVAVGFCKITGKCQLNYEEYVPVSQLRSYVTPEHLQTAEKFFVSAMEKYAEKRRAVPSKHQQIYY